jgi:hypothetical protein
VWSVLVVVAFTVAVAAIFLWNHGDQRLGALSSRQQPDAADSASDASVEEVGVAVRPDRQQDLRNNAD